MRRFSLSFSDASFFTVAFGLVFGFLGLSQGQPENAALAFTMFGLGTYFVLAYRVTTTFDDAQRCVTICSGLWPWRRIRQISYFDLQKFLLGCRTYENGRYFDIRLCTNAYPKGIRLEIFNEASIELMEARAQEAAKACGIPVDYANSYLSIRDNCIDSREQRHRWASWTLAVSLPCLLVAIYFLLVRQGATLPFQKEILSLYREKSRGSSTGEGIEVMGWILGGAMGMIGLGNFMLTRQRG